MFYAFSDGTKIGGSGFSVELIENSKTENPNQQFTLSTSNSDRTKESETPTFYSCSSLPQDQIPLTFNQMNENLNQQDLINIANNPSREEFLYELQLLQKTANEQMDRGIETNQFEWSLEQSSQTSSSQINLFDATRIGLFPQRKLVFQFSSFPIISHYSGALNTEVPTLQNHVCMIQPTSNPIDNRSRHQSSEATALQSSRSDEAKSGELEQMPTTSTNRDQENRARGRCNCQSNVNVQQANQVQRLPNQPPAEAPP